MPPRRLFPALAVFILAACTPATPPLILLNPTTTPSSTTGPETRPDAPPPTVTPSPTALPSPAPTVPPVVRFMAVGDLMLGRAVGDRLLTDGPAAPFAAVASLLSSADLLAGNLECAISNRGAPEPKTYTFRAPPVAAEALALAGFDAVSLANNHALDYGPVALTDTLTLLAYQNVAAVGAGRNEAEARAPVVLERAGLRVAFIAYANVPVEDSGFDTRQWIAGPASPGIAWADPARMAADIAAARAQSDLVIVLLHFGLEGRDLPSDSQRATARAAIDAGAALVIGSHPHVLQGVEKYNGGLIVYSLGNFVFDEFGYPENYSAIFTATLTRTGIESYDFLPVVIEDGLPRPATPDEAPAILARVQPVP